MVSAFSVEVTLPIPADVLWRVRASRPFMSFLVSNGALNRMDATSARPLPGRPTTYTRTQTYVPAEITIPEIVKPVFDDSYIQVADIQTWDDTARPLEQGFEIRPSVMADIVTSHGQLVLRPLPKGAAGNKRDDTSCLQVLSGECCVSIPFVGWYAEQAIIANMRTFYNQYPAHIAQFVDMVVKRWGNGRRDSLRPAVDKMLAEEKALQ